MLLLHLSDIHFRDGFVGTKLDPNAHLRNELLRDAEDRCSKLGPADAVLVTGDLTFAGDPAEFQYAREWLELLCKKCGTNLSAVFFCPGNHDVVRKTASRPTIQALHKAIKDAADIALDATITGLLKDEESGRLLYESLGNYNNFAAQFLCDLLPPYRTIAQRDLRLNDGSILRLSGLNSTFVSSQADAEGQLYVDLASRQISRERGVEHLVMCHHPYGWLRQGNLLRDHLNSVARLHLFGHEHTNRIELARDWVRIAAGAAHPDREEAQWEPGYNLIELNVTGTGLTRTLDVRVHVRVWQQSPDQFRAKMDRAKDVFESSLSLEPWAPETTDQPSSQTMVQTVAANPTTPAPLQPPQIAPLIAQTRVDPMVQLRDLSLRFYRLTLSQKSAIAGKLSLMEEADVNQPDFERFRRALLRARDRGLLDDLEREIGAVEKPQS